MNRKGRPDLQETVIDSSESTYPCNSCLQRRNEKMDSTYCKGCDDLDYKENMSGQWQPWCLFWDCWVENVGSCDKFD